jgi:hypothetical protein
VGRIYDGVRVDLSSESRRGLQNLAGFRRFIYARKFLRDAGDLVWIAAIQVKQNDVATRIRQSCDRPAATILGITGMAACDDNLPLPSPGGFSGGTQIRRSNQPRRKECSTRKGVHVGLHSATSAREWQDDAFNLDEAFRAALPQALQCQRIQF